MEQTYHIFVETPLGIRTGKMRVEVDGKNVSGRLEILGKREQFSGCFQKDGGVEIKGDISLATRRMQYKGTGILDEEHVELELEGDRNRLTLRGSRRKEKEEQQDEEVL